MTLGLLLAAIPLAYFAVVLVLTAAYFALAWFFRARRPPEVRIGMRATLRLVWREYLALVGAVPRLVLHRFIVRDPPPSRVDVPVVLVHGVLCNAGIWTRFVRFLGRADVAGVYALSYGPPLASIEAFAEQLARKIDEALAATAARQVIVIAHSMGGLVARAYLRRYGAAKVARVLTIGSPHHGSVFASCFPGVCLAQMRLGNPWLARLNAAPRDPALRFVSLWSWHDSMVAPQTSSELPGAIDVPLIGIGHNALLGDAQVFAYALAEIVAARSAHTPDAASSGAAPGGQGQAG